MKFQHLLGRSVLILMTTGEDVLLKVMQVSDNYVAGYDDEGMNRTIIETKIHDYMVVS